MAEKSKKKARSNKGKKKPAVPASQGVTLGDLLGKKLEHVKRESEEKQKKMVKEARDNPAVQRSSEKFAAAIAKKSVAKPKAAPKTKSAAR
ncbi:MAG: hypothetical protein LBQ76_08645 [Candidatus Fibromonas sp.]|jgi:hypothetical protein|nr:hypothetical protein [Candidatus Fibromonas sp.]